MGRAEWYSYVSLAAQQIDLSIFFYVFCFSETI